MHTLHCQPGGRHMKTHAHMCVCCRPWGRKAVTGGRRAVSRPCLRAGGFLPPLRSGSKRGWAAEPAPAGEMPGLPSNVYLLECEQVLGQRFVDVSKMSAEALRNEVSQEDETPQWLVSGKFGTGARDRGFYTCAYLSEH